MTDINFNIGSEKIFATKYGDGNVQVVFLHGAGKANRLRTRYISERMLAIYDISSYSIDFSGHGDSSGSLEESSLKKRLNEFMGSLDFFNANKKEIIIFATSMAGHIAIKSLDFFRPKGLFLFCPAIYPEKSFDVPFKKGFSEIIRVQDSWKDNGLIDILRNNESDINLYIGRDDTVIPDGVIKFIMDNSIACNFSLNYFSQANHMIHSYLSSNNKELDKICFNVNSLLNGD